MKTCIIVIPIYKDNLSDMEIMSLNQVFSFYYNKYEDIDICLLCPNRIDPYKILNYVQFIKTNNFTLLLKLTDEYFESTFTYSNLICKNKLFYEYFFDYEYMLIYQLDAFIFKDELHYWCDKGYTYIGALNFNYYTSEFPDVQGNINGGLSLRKIKDFYNVLDDIENNRLDISPIIHESNVDDICEDGYFTVIFHMLNKLPPYKDTLKFCYTEHNDFLLSIFYPELPFGLHYIHKSSIFLKNYKKYINFNI